MLDSPFRGLGLVGRYGLNRLTLVIEGPGLVKDKLRKYLTIRNEGIGFQIMKCKELISFWSIRITNEEDGYASLKVMKAKEELVKLEEEYEQVFYEDTDEGLVIPAGYWYLCDSIVDDIHLNKDVKTFHVEGSRDYQIEAVNEAMKYKRATVVLATGLGKSRILLNISISLAKAGKRSFIVVPTEYLVGQVYNTIKPHWDSVTAVGGKRKHPTLGADIFVCTAASAIKHIGSYDAVIIDESHRSTCSTWLNLILAADKADYCYNLTATPFRADGMDLAIHAFGGPTVYRKDVRWGINEGWLSPCKIYLATITPKDRSGDALSFPDKTLAAVAYKKLIANRDVFSYLESQVKRMLDAGKKVIVVFKTVGPGKAFQKYCKGRIEFDVADSKYKKPLDDFRDGKCNILVSNSSLISEGIDLPGADVLFILTQHSSPVVSYQIIGRVLRRAPGKEYAIVIDVMTPGYKQFESSRNKRLKIFSEITDDIIEIRGK